MPGESDAEWDGSHYRGESWMQGIEYFYTRETLPNPKYEIGAYTYGTPIVYDWEQGTTLKIGKYSCIADGVTILLGGNHHTECPDCRRRSTGLKVSARSGKAPLPRQGQPGAPIIEAQVRSQTPLAVRAAAGRAVEPRRWHEVTP